MLKECPTLPPAVYARSLQHYHTDAHTRRAHTPRVCAGALLSQWAAARKKTRPVLLRCLLAMLRLPHRVLGKRSGYAQMSLSKCSNIKFIPSKYWHILQKRHTESRKNTMTKSKKINTLYIEVKTIIYFWREWYLYPFTFKLHTFLYLTKNVIVFT